MSNFPDGCTELDIEMALGGFEPEPDWDSQKERAVCQSCGDEEYFWPDEENLVCPICGDWMDFDNEFSFENDIARVKKLTEQEEK